jgi:hypothetical protein
VNPGSQEKSRSSLRGPGARPRGALSLNGAGAGPKLTPLYVVIFNCEGSGMRRCHNCGQALIKIDNQGERLAGCLTCNSLGACRRQSLDQAFRGRSARTAPVTT